MTRGTIEAMMRERRCDVLVAGGGLGGVAAALAATSRGLDVVMTEPTDWIGGQLTSQAVPPDEHRWIERYGCSATYRALRDGIRAHYRAHSPLTDAARAVVALNPGACTVSRLGHEPRVALAVLEAMLAPARAAGRLELLLLHAPVAAATSGDRVEAVTVNGPRGEQVIHARWFLDATETGALLPLTGAEHVTGFESARRTEEPHGPDEDQPDNFQPVTVCFALDHLDGEDHTIEKPPGYERFADRFDWVAPDPRTNLPVARRLDPNPAEDPLAIGPDFDEPELDKDLWRFRRIAARGLFRPGSYPSDITLVNWPQVDHSDAPVLDGDDDGGARALNRSFLYWMQTNGFPGLRLRADVVGDTPDGLAKAAYVREGRRLVALRTVVEQDIALDVRGEHGAVRFPDSVGVGHYRIDLHPSTGGDPYIDLATCPFQLPLGALVPVRLENLLAAGKAIGTTHITNGAYRLHPIEWNAGEAAGHLAGFCASRGAAPHAVCARPGLLAAFQRQLDAAGIEREWPHGAAASDTPPAFALRPH
jgi:FAD dependent oxidoreductase